MTQHIALLRGINLGSRNRVAMPALREMLEARGFGAVRTLVQSGNVVLESDLGAEALEQELEGVLAAEFGVETKIVTRTRDEIAAVVALNPLGDVATQPKRHQVSFLSAAPAPEVVRALLDADVAPERVAVHGREVYAWHPEGVQRSPLVRMLSDRKLGVTATARNWNTVTGLLALADG